MHYDLDLFNLLGFLFYLIHWQKLMNEDKEKTILAIQGQEDLENDIVYEVNKIKRNMRLGLYRCRWINKNKIKNMKIWHIKSNLLYLHVFECRLIK